MEVTFLTEKCAISNMIDNTIHAGLTCVGIPEKKDSVIPQVYIGALIDRGHDSVLEHIVFTWKVEGVSRALLQELARHRHISLSVESTRYTLFKTLFNEDDGKMFDVLGQIDYNIDRSIGDIMNDVSFKNKEDADAVVDTLEDLINNISNYLCKLIVTAHELREALTPSQINGFIKYFLPEAMPTNFVVTMNLREFRHILKLRLSKEALREFRVLAYCLYKTLPCEYMWLVNDCINNDVVDDIEGQSEFEIDAADNDNNNKANDEEGEKRFA